MSWRLFPGWHRFPERPPRRNGTYLAQLHDGSFQVRLWVHGAKDWDTKPWAVAYWRKLRGPVRPADAG